MHIVYDTCILTAHTQQHIDQVIYGLHGSVRECIYIYIYTDVCTEGDPTSIYYMVPAALYSIDYIDYIKYLYIYIHIPAETVMCGSPAA